MSVASVIWAAANPASVLMDPTAAQPGFRQRKLRTWVRGPSQISPCAHFAAVSRVLRLKPRRRHVSSLLLAANFKTTQKQHKLHWRRGTQIQTEVTALASVDIIKQLWAKTTMLTAELTHITFWGWVDNGSCSHYERGVPRVQVLVVGRS